MLLSEFRLAEDDLIECHDFERLCDVKWEEGDKEPDSGTVFVHLDQIIPFFKKCRTNNYVVVSAESDFGVCYQRYNPPALDYLKWVHFLPLIQLGYNPLYLPPRCDPEQCNIEDKFSVKMYSYTKGTFPEIPSNIKLWLSTNCSIQEEGVYGIPFGVAHWAIEHILKYRHSPKDKNLYVNFSDNTLERVQIKSQLKSWQGVTLIQETVSHDEYFRDLSQHKFVLCPPGNGLDCYRIWEALYCGCIPIVIKGPSMIWFQHLPIIHVSSIYDLNFELMDSWYSKLYNEQKFSFDYLSLSFWREHLKNQKELLLN